MPLSIYPLKLGELDVDYSFVAFQYRPGTTVTIPVTAWLILGVDKPILVDSGFRDLRALTSQGFIARQPAEQTLEAQLAHHQLHPSDIGYLIHTHLHVDHCGYDDHFPNAKILVQRAELQYAAAPIWPTGQYDRIDIAKLIDPLWSQIELLDGESELFPGIRTVHTGGHSPAHQVLYVEVPSGTAIIAGDAAYIASINVKLQVPAGYWINIADEMAALRRLAQEGKHILPSHDPEVYERYPHGIL